MEMISSQSFSADERHPLAASPAHGLEHKFKVLSVRGQLGRFRGRQTPRIDEILEMLHAVPDLIRALAVIELLSHHPLTPKI